MEAAGLDAEALHATGMENLVRLASERTRLQPHGHIFALFLDGNFEASLLLLDDLWERALAGYIQGGFVVAVPARDVPGRDVPASYVATADVPSTVHVCPLSSCRWLPGSSHGGKGVSNDYADVRKRGAY